MPGLATTSPLPIVAVKNISRDYPGVRALRDVSLDLRAGEVHALVGENGAGKSTLIRVLSGDARPDHGTIQIRGRNVKFASPSDARGHGIVAIFQELMIVPELSVAENVLLGNEPGPAGFLYSRQEAERRTAAVLRSLGGRTRYRSTMPCRPPVDGTEADRGDRARSRASGSGDHHGRADGGALGERGGGAAPDHSAASRRRGIHSVRFPPPG